MRQCVTTTSLQVLVNGEPTETIFPSCGLRQGDPLSPYLFVLCMEVFSALLRKAEREQMFRGICISRSAPPISHLFFADDLLVCFQASPRSCAEVMSVIKLFCEVSGQMVNHHKSLVRFSSNTPSDYADSMARSLQLSSRESMGMYLGVPVEFGRSKCSTFSVLVDSVARRISDLSSIPLTAAAKLVVINSVLVASVVHVLSVFKVPQTVCDRLSSLLSRFWRSSSTGRGSPLVSGSHLSFPKGWEGWVSVIFDPLIRRCWQNRPGV